MMKLWSWGWLVLQMRLSTVYLLQLHEPWCLLPGLLKYIKEWGLKANAAARKFWAGSKPIEQVSGVLKLLKCLFFPISHSSLCICSHQVHWWRCGRRECLRTSEARIPEVFEAPNVYIFPTNRHAFIIERCPTTVLMHEVVSFSLEIGDIILTFFSFRGCFVLAWLFRAV